jgi:hypothetical protein
VPGPCRDTFVSEQVLVALDPAALELSLAAAEQVEQERAVRLQPWQQRRERAAYEADRAARQYQAVEPENRLVARTLERAWEEKLTAQQQLQESYHRFLQPPPRGLSDEERNAIRRLAADIPALWHAPTTTAADRQEVVRQVVVRQVVVRQVVVRQVVVRQVVERQVVERQVVVRQVVVRQVVERQVVERVEVAVQGTSEQVQVRISWVGGGQTEGTLTRPIARFVDRSDYAARSDRVRTLTDARWSAPAIARQLEADGYAPWRAGRTWTMASVLTLRRQLGLSGQHQRGRSCEALGPQEWWAADLARALGGARSLLHTWIQRGLVHARQEAQGMPRWIVQADPAAVERLRQYHQRDRTRETRRRWTAPDHLSAPPRKE